MKKSEWEILEDNLKGESAPPDFKDKVMQACREFDSLYSRELEKGGVDSCIIIMQLIRRSLSI